MKRDDIYSDAPSDGRLIFFFFHLKLNHND